MDDRGTTGDELGREVARSSRGTGSARLGAVDSAPGPTPLDFDCPRCGVAVTEGFYGPCEACRGVLRATVGREAREVAATRYEPRMNVTPNAVATKD